MPRKKIISAGKLDMLFRQVENSNNEESFQKLLYEYENMRKTANRRLADIEKADLGFYSAYNSTMYALNTEGYRRFPKISADDAENDYESFRKLTRQVRRFMASKLSTVGRIKQYEQSQVDFWMTHFPEMEKTADNKNAIKDLLRQDMVEFAELYGSEFVREAVDFLSSGNSMRTLQERIEQVKTGTRRYANIFDR